MSRVPIRLRVTLAFTAAMALVLIAIGFFVYNRLEARLDESINNGLRSRAGEVTALARTSERNLGAAHGASLIESDESFAQVLTTDGRIVDTTPQLRDRPVLDSSQLARAAAEPIFFERAGLPGIDTNARLLAAPVKTSSGTVIVVVGSSLGDRNDALDGLTALFLIGGSIGLLLASLVGYLATGAALRPVEAMRRRAAAISASGPEERLPIPPARDQLQRLGLTLNEMLERIDATLERERRFLDDASHELRTPLALHKTELELALRQGESEAELREAITDGLVEVDRLVQLAEDLLIVARSEDGRPALELEPIDVAGLLAGVATRFRARAAAAGRGLAVADGAGAAIEGDRLRLEQALTNLVDNALRHGAGEVRIWTAVEPGVVSLHVGDEGSGFAPDFLDHAFERFSRADPARGRGGTGLGLAIVEMIAAAHGGRAVAANRPDGGADVWLEIPTRRPV
ncbi:MAG TPA: ATP-binding protein [Solirubrobacterales bacterium]|nr:ATP-binding protein [Solirubrobacterales bacterium]